MLTNNSKTGSEPQVRKVHKTLVPGTPEFNMKKEFIKSEITGKVRRYFGKPISKAIDIEVYRATALTIRSWKNG